MRLMVPRQLVALQSKSLMVEDTPSATGLLSLDTSILQSKTIWWNLLNSWRVLILHHLVSSLRANGMTDTEIWLVA